MSDNGFKFGAPTNLGMEQAAAASFDEAWNPTTQRVRLEFSYQQEEVYHYFYRQALGLTFKTSF